MVLKVRIVGSIVVGILVFAAYVFGYASFHNSEYEKEVLVLNSQAAYAIDAVDEGCGETPFYEGQYLYTYFNHVGWHYWERMEEEGGTVFVEVYDVEIKYDSYFEHVIIRSSANGPTIESFNNSINNPEVEQLYLETALRELPPLTFARVQGQPSSDSAYTAVKVTCSQVYKIDWTFWN